jgi:hypothetical protein
MKNKSKLYLSASILVFSLSLSGCGNTSPGGVGASGEIASDSGVTLSKIELYDRIDHKMNQKIFDILKNESAPIKLLNRLKEATQKSTSFTALIGNRTPTLFQLLEKKPGTLTTILGLPFDNQGLNNVVSTNLDTYLENAIDIRPALENWFKTLPEDRRRTLMNKIEKLVKNEQASLSSIEKEAMCSVADFNFSQFCRLKESYAALKEGVSEIADLPTVRSELLMNITGKTDGATAQTDIKSRINSIQQQNIDHLGDIIQRKTPVGVSDAMVKGEWSSYMIDIVDGVRNTVDPNHNRSETAALRDQFSASIQSGAQENQALYKKLSLLFPDVFPEKVEASRPLELGSDSLQGLERGDRLDTPKVDTSNAKMNGNYVVSLAVPITIMLKGDWTSLMTSDRSGRVSTRFGNTLIGAQFGYKNQGDGFVSSSTQKEGAVSVTQQYSSFFIEGLVGSVVADQVHQSNWAGSKMQVKAGIDLAWMSPFVQIHRRDVSFDGVKQSETTTFFGLDAGSPSFIMGSALCKLGLIGKMGYEVSLTPGMKYTMSLDAQIRLQEGLVFGGTLDLGHQYQQASLSFSLCR